MCLTRLKLLLINVNVITWFIPILFSQMYYETKKAINTRIVILECYCVARKRPLEIRRIISVLLFIGKGTPFCCVNVIQVKYIKGMIKISMFSVCRTLFRVCVCLEYANNF